MARIRTFIAVDLAPGVKSRVTALQEKLGRSATSVKWAPPENFHLTLLFLGEVEQLDVVSICRLVQQRAKKHAPFNLEVARVGAFPNLRRPKILWAGIAEGVAELQSLHDDLEEGLLDLGCYRREDREYTPHLTLGRLSHEDREEDWATTLTHYTDWAAGSSPVDEVLVMASERRRGGPEYSVLGRGPLAGRTAKPADDEDE
ncbi:MAG TPA: RNA 2',3'-cyclic phosphodiesterase [Gemmataceae bacterium]|jgi:2'-5' RNA ligase|nr:RNA 2',3'-cyclic phosphodiesterase [Gemmataceae bacterium]